MANVSFEFLDQALSIEDTSLIAHSTNENASPTNYSYITTGGDDIDFYGPNFAYITGFPISGAVNRIELDPDNDDAPFLKEVQITGLSFPILEIPSWTAAEQTSRFWRVVLEGDDILDFTLADYSATLIFAGDGGDLVATIARTHVGGDDSFLSSGIALTSASTFLAGDFLDLESNVRAVGGADFLDVTASKISGDFRYVQQGSSAIGGDDVIKPLLLADNGSGLIEFFGDAQIVFGFATTNGALAGGDDIIDLRSTDISGFTQSVSLIGDAWVVQRDAIMAGGDDTIYGSSYGEGIYGDYQFKTGVVTGGDDLLYGFGGDDTINGGAGNDEIFGGDGADAIDGSVGRDSILGGDGADTVLGGEENDTIRGGDDNDSLFGGPNNDLLFGEAGKDRLYGNDGNDALYGGDGVDVLEGRDGNDSLYGEGGVDFILGGAGADYIEGGKGNDNLRGREAGDTMLGGTGDDTMIGEAGPDDMRGGDGADTLSGGSSNDTIRGGAGNDRAYGDDGDDLLFGHAGVDVLEGRNGNDFIKGDAGNDYILGGTGIDSMFGGADDDVFVFTNDGDIDYIGDFAGGAGASDVIRLDGYGASFDTFAEVIAAATQSGPRVIIDFGGGDQLHLLDTNLTSLNADDFIFN